MNPLQELSHAMQLAKLVEASEFASKEKAMAREYMRASDDDKKQIIKDMLDAFESATKITGQKRNNPDAEELVERLQFIDKQERQFKIADGKVYVLSLTEEAGKGTYVHFDCCEHIVDVVRRALAKANEKH